MYWLISGSISFHSSYVYRKEARKPVFIYIGESKRDPRGVHFLSEASLYLLGGVASSDGRPQHDVAQLQEPSRQTSHPEGALLLIAVSPARPRGPHRESGEGGVMAVRGSLRGGFGRVAVVDGT